MPSSTRPRATVLLTAAAVCLASAGFAGRAAVGGRLDTILRGAPVPARPLPLSAVRLTGGPLQHAQQLDADYLLKLEPDRMLSFYRQRAGLTPKAEPYGGWDGEGRNLTGHIAGHYLSAVSLMWAATGDVRFKQRADYIVNELREVQDKQGDGYAGALMNGKEAFLEVSKGNIKSSAFDLNGLWSPWYVLHKTFAGLRDAYRYTGNKTALDVEVKFAGWAETILAPLDAAQTQKMLNTEFGGMPEVLADLYADTGDARWLALSHHFDHDAVLGPLERHVDPLAGLHGNTQIPKALGYAVRFLYTGDAGDGFASGFFFDRVAHDHSFATGGDGKDEYFREPDKLSRILDGRTAESCNVYNMVKFSRLLFSLRPDPEYAEFQERALFNHILGSIDPSDGSMCYMVPVGRAVRREYQDMFQDFTCCVGTGMESHALHGDGIYYESGDRLWVNIYAPSTARWESAGVALKMDTTFPEGDAANLSLTLDRPKAFTLALRRPSWAGDGFSVTVDGERLADVPPAGKYVELTRTWKTGDTVGLVLPKALRLEPTPDNPHVAAIMWGPLVLAGDLGPEPSRARGTPPGPAVTSPVLVAGARPIADWLKPEAGKPGDFQTVGVGRDRDVELVPFYRLQRRTYSAYWDIYTPAEWDTKSAELAAEAERLKRLEANTVAYLRPGPPQTEQPFNPQGDGTTLVNLDGRRGRTARNWFSYDLAVDGASPMRLVATYSGDSRRPRAFAILVDGTRVADVSLPANSDPGFFDGEYPIPPEAVRGKQKVTVRFQSSNGGEIAAVFGLRMVRGK